MASSPPPPLSSFSTALVLLPPPQIQSRINPLRSANDKSFPRWTSHLTLMFPFVDPPALPAACTLLRNALSKVGLHPFHFQLDRVGKFQQWEHDTVYLGPSQPSEIQRLWEAISSAFGYSGRPLVPHLTLGQARRDGASAFLQSKGELLLEQVIEWDVCSIVVLRKSETEGGLMEMYEEISLSSEYPLPQEAIVTGLRPAMHRIGPERPTPCFLTASQPKKITVATYNIFHDSRVPIKTRFQALLSTLLAVQPIPDIVCLQEVTDEFLRLFVADPGIRSRWPLCTHDPTSVLPNERNVICLAQDAFNFVWEYAQLNKHKPAVILQASFHGIDPLIIAGIHLTAGLKAPKSLSKLEELDTLTQSLQQHHSSSPWIIIGDFNVPTSQAIPQSIMKNFHDSWLTVHGSEHGGATYDPESNALAAESVKDDPSPQRYDRVWVRRNMGVKVDSIEKFGLESDASDHYGLIASFSLGVDAEIEPVLEVGNMALEVGNMHHDPRIFAGSRAVESDERLEKTVRQLGGFPTTSQQDERVRVTTILRNILSVKTQGPSAAEVDSQQSTSSPSPTQPQSAVKFEFVPVGSFGIGVDTQDSDVDILVVGNIPPRTFWSLARALLHKSASKLPDTSVMAEVHPSPVTVKRFVKDASVPMMELVVGNVRVDMQYASASKALGCWDQIHTLPPTDPVFLLPALSLRTLNAYRTLLAVLRAIPTASLPAFRLAHRALKLFLVSHGIYSSRLGYLGGIHLTLLLTRITLLAPPDSSAMQLIHAFFAMYADWDWAQDAVTIPRLNDMSTYTRAVGREPMVIMSIEKPMINVVQNANQHTLDAIVSSFKNVHRHLVEGAHWTNICGSGGICGNVFESTFLSSHESYIKLDLLLWGNSTVKARAWVSYVESRLPQLLAHLQASYPDWSVRLWPSRLVDANNSGRLATGLQSLYLLGLSPRKSTPIKKVDAFLLSFEDQLRRNEKFYDSTEMFVSVSKVGAMELPKSITTPSAWMDNDIDPYDDSSNEGEIAEPSEDERDMDAVFAPISSKQLKQARTQHLKSKNTPYVAAPKLRTSSDVYYRILWDRELDVEDYLIGYEDRFSGLKEIPVTSWKRDVEHEDFVPFHRVVHFRRKSDGVLIWDRRNKIDLMFGSGVQQKPS